MASSNLPAQRLFEVWGTVTDVTAGQVRISGVSELAGIGNEIVIKKAGTEVRGEVLSVSREYITALLFSSSTIIRIGDVAYIEPEPTVSPGNHWLGHVVDYRGRVSGAGNTHVPASLPRALHASPPPAGMRKMLGGRLHSGLMMMDTLLPISRGQRVGIFAGSGVGKSTLMGRLARGVQADRVVIALIGERSREVNEFVEKTLTPAIREKTVIVTATANEAPSAKKRAAYCAMAAAEHFRDEGHSVLLLFDSITRFAEAHRETALMANETPALNAFPPSTVRVVAELAERSGPGTATQGDITAIFTVLVAGSDLEEPVADMVRGILDGHMVLSREIAERGRYPAIDVLRSVSRCLPDAATAEENEILKDCRRVIALFEDVQPMLRANLYEFGKDLEADRAIALYPAIDAFIGDMNTGGIEDAFTALQSILAGGGPSVESPAEAVETEPKTG